ncbi:MAG TPA: dihydroorotate dehydrogenase [Bacteroidota bacterium]|nr:dihydroorotate dehydrogenase [Bacteroidota bacterium]
MARSSFKLAGVPLKNRVLVASGTYGYGDDCRDLADPALLGGIITKSLSLKPRTGNPPVRIAETPSGMLNSIGLANIGVHRFIREKLPFLKSVDTAVFANIAASTVEEYCEVLSLLNAEEGIDGYEINVSCPNVREGGLNFGTNVSSVAEITRRLRPLTRRPLIIKLTPNVTHIAEFARAAEAEGADAVSVINTLIGMAIDIRTRKPVLSTVTGGLSGPAIKPVALAKVYETARAVRIPVLGIGGIASASDAIEFLLAGATAVQVGTANFIDPAAGITIAAGIAAYCDQNGIDDTGALVGALDAGKGVSVVDSWL